MLINIDTKKAFRITSNLTSTPRALNYTNVGFVAGWGLTNGTSGYPQGSTAVILFTTPADLKELKNIRFLTKRYFLYPIKTPQMKENMGKFRFFITKRFDRNAIPFNFNNPTEQTKPHPEVLYTGTFKMFPREESFESQTAPIHYNIWWNQGFIHQWLMPENEKIALEPNTEYYLVLSSQTNQLANFHLSDAAGPIQLEIKY